MPHLLALDTATRQATVAVTAGPNVLAEAHREVTTHSEGLLALIHEALTAAGLTARDLDAVVCGRGPGSFTGLRIGLATAKGLCLAANTPLLALSSLQPLGMITAEALAPPPLVAAVVDARRQEVFCALYRGGSEERAAWLQSPEALAAELSALGQPVVLAGDGALLYQDVLLGGIGGAARLAPEGCHVIRARYLAQAALPRLAAGDHDDLAAVVPHYIRPSDARLPVGPGSLKHQG